MPREIPPKDLQIEKSSHLFAVWMDEVMPCTAKELQLAARLIKFVRERKAAQQSGRIEIHADQNGVVSKCAQFLNDAV